MNACPPLERLVALLRGEVGESEGGEIEDHLDLCEPC